MKHALAGCTLCLVLLSNSTTLGQSPAVGKEKKLIFHDIRTDARGHLLPWYDPEPGKSYDHVLRLVWGIGKKCPATGFATRSLNACTPSGT
jgi:hypothetical protein